MLSLQCAPCTNGDNIGAMLRLAFHDAVGGGGVNGNGGSNGCIDASAADNKGLDMVISQYEGFYAKYSTIISRADLWAFGARVALQYATTVQSAGIRAAPLNDTPLPSTLTLPFTYGRVDDSSCTGLDGSFLPAASNAWSQIFGRTFTHISLAITRPSPPPVFN